MGSIIASVLIAGGYFVQFNDGFSGDHQRWGTFGDYLGGVLSPLLSFFTLIAMLITINLQTKELKATREELSRSAIAQEQTEKSISAQLKTLEAQRFDSVFFSLVDQHTKVASYLRDDARHRELARVFVNDLDKSIKEDEGSFAEIANKALMKLPLRYQLYSDSVCQVLKFISKKSAGAKVTDLAGPGQRDSEDGAEELMYAEIFRSMQDSTGLYIFAVHCVANKQRYSGCVELAARYRFFCNVSTKLTALNETIAREFGPEAVGRVSTNPA